MDTKKPKLSVIMIAYNHAAYIKQALDSILRQKTVFSFEILVGDDCSTDETASIISEYAHRFPDRITAVIRPQNIGATKNLYDLITRAQGEYIAYLEGDDYWTEVTKLQQQLDFLDKNPQFIACTHKVDLVDNVGSLCAETIPWIWSKEVYTIQNFDGVVLPGHINSLVHRNIFRDNLHTYKDLITLHTMIADRSLCLLLATEGPIYQLQSVMGSYRKPAASRISATNVLYESNAQKTWDDYVYTKRLESYVALRLPVAVSFEPHKQKLLMEAICTALRKPYKKNFCIIFRIIKSEKRVKYVFSTIVLLIKKIFDKLRKR